MRLTGELDIVSASLGGRIAQLIFENWLCVGFGPNRIAGMAGDSFITGEARRTIDDRFRITLPAEMSELVADADGHCILAKERAGCLSLWKAADWFEREACEMFGVRFEGHPNLKKLLLFEGFEGRPLRKDYPIAKRQKIPVPEETL